MSLQLLKTDIETGNIRKLYYICGEESYLKHYYFSELKKTLFGEVSDHPDCLTREGAEITVSEITDAAGAYPMLAEKKAVIIIDLKMSDPVTSWITQKASELEDNIVIIKKEKKSL